MNIEGLFSRNTWEHEVPTPASTRAENSDLVFEQGPQRFAELLYATCDDRFSELSRFGDWVIDVPMGTKGRDEMIRLEAPRKTYGDPLSSNVRISIVKRRGSASKDAGHDEAMSISFQGLEGSSRPRADIVLSRDHRVYVASSIDMPVDEVLERAIDAIATIRISSAHSKLGRDAIAQYEQSYLPRKPSPGQP